MLDPRAIAVEDRETERFAAMTPAERLELFLQLCELTDEIVRHRPDAEAIRAPTPRSADSEALWARLIEQARVDRR